MKHKLFISVLSCLLLNSISCSSDDETVDNFEEVEEEVVEEESEPDDPVQTVYPVEGETGNVLLYDNSL
ncbi:hypothetical protein, partial [Maribacter dokdonensis]